MSYYYALLHYIWFAGLSLPNGEVEQGEPLAGGSAAQNSAWSQSQHGPFSEGLVTDSSPKEDKARRAI